MNHEKKLRKHKVAPDGKAESVVKFKPAPEDEEIIPAPKKHTGKDSQRLQWYKERVSNMRSSEFKWEAYSQLF